MTRWAVTGLGIESFHKPGIFSITLPSTYYWVFKGIKQDSLCRGYSAIPRSGGGYFKRSACSFLDEPVRHTRKYSSTTLAYNYSNVKVELRLRKKLIQVVSLFCTALKIVRKYVYALVNKKISAGTFVFVWLSKFHCVNTPYLSKAFLHD